MQQGPAPAALTDGLRLQVTHHGHRQLMQGKRRYALSQHSRPASGLNGSAAAARPGVVATEGADDLRLKKEGRKLK